MKNMSSSVDEIPVRNKSQGTAVAAQPALPTMRAWVLKDEFEHFWDYRYPASAKKFLSSSHPTMRTFVGTVRTHLVHIMFIDRPLRTLSVRANLIRHQTRQSTSDHYRLKSTTVHLDIPAKIRSQFTYAVERVFQARFELEDDAVPYPSRTRTAPAELRPKTADLKRQRYQAHEKKQECAVRVCVELTVPYSRTIPPMNRREKKM